jgi:hypothetical protein
MRHRTKRSCPSDQEPEVCLPLVYVMFAVRYVDNDRLHHKNLHHRTSHKTVPLQRNMDPGVFARL